MATKLTSGLVDTLEMTEYGEHTQYEAAEIVVDTTRCLVVLEPRDRNEANGIWEHEDEWRTKVENYTMDYLNDLEGVEGQACLVYDPARDATEELILGRFYLNEDGYIQFDREDEIAR